MDDCAACKSVDLRLGRFRNPVGDSTESNHMNISKNKAISFGGLVILFLVMAFFAGATYGVKQLRALQATTGATNTAYGGARMRGTGGLAGGFTTGQIIAKDATSITVQLISGGPSGTPSGSKIVFLDINTKVTKQVSGTLADLAVGTDVSVTGTPNTDGSISATAVQIRPANTVRPTQ